MKKMFLLSLLFIPAAVYSMEVEKPALPVVKRKLTLLERYKRDVQEDKGRGLSKMTAIEVEKLDLDLHLKKAENWIWQSHSSPLRYLVMCKFPKRTYLYVEDSEYTNKYALYNCNIDDLNPLHRIKKAQYNGFSAIGVTTLAESLTLDERRELINRMFAAGFQSSTTKIKNSLSKLKENKQTKNFFILIINPIYSINKRYKIAKQ